VHASVKYLLVHKQGQIISKIGEQFTSDRNTSIFVVKGQTNMIVGAGNNINKFPFELTTTSQVSEPNNLHLIVLERTSHPKGELLPAPTLLYQHLGSEEQISEVEVEVSICCYVPVDQPLYSSSTKIFACVRAQASAISKLFNENSASVSAVPTAFHFCPPGFSHVITAIYPINKSLSYDDNDIRLEKLRALYHQQLVMLPLDPLL
jgi:hypothetical protein